MSLLPSVPPALASAAGGVSKANTTQKAPADASAGSGPTPGIAASEESGDRDADGRDHSRRRHGDAKPDLDTARQKADGVSTSGGLDVSV